MNCKLGDVCESISFTFRRQLDKVVLINTSDVLDGKVTNHAYVPNENLRGQFKKSFQQNDILYSEIRPKNRRFAFIDFDASDYVASTKLMVIRANENILPEFLFQVLKSDEVIDQLQLMAETRSGTFPQITFSELAALDICIPSIAEQQTIAATLSALDDKIENNIKTNNNLEQIVRAIYKSWFVDFEPFQNYEFIESELDRIPNGWDVVPLSDCCSLITRGITPKYTGFSDQIIINQKCIRNHQISLLPSRFHVPKAITEKWLRYGDVLVNSTGQGTLGRTAQWLENTENVTVDSHVSIVRPRTRQLIYYLGQFVMSKEREIEAMAAGSTGQTELSRDRLGSLLMIRPTPELLDRFSELVEPLMLNIISNNQESEKLANVRDTLLPRLISREVSVTSKINN